jgi:hypothetical protein
MFNGPAFAVWYNYSIVNFLHDYLEIIIEKNAGTITEYSCFLDI